MRLVVSLCILLTACGRIGYSSSPLAGDSSPTPPDSGAPVDAADVGTDATRDAAPDSGVTDSGPADSGLTDSGITSPDAGMCDEAPCRLVAPQCGCAGGTVCQRPGGDTTLRACVAPGTSDVGEACLGNLACQEAAVCVATGFSSGLCHAYCASGADCPTGVCLELVVMSEDIGACMDSCDPVAGSPCAGGTGCGIGYTRNVPDRDFIFATRCLDPALPALDQPCPVGACGPALVCDAGSCRQVCELPAGTCPGTLTCRSLSPRAVVGAREYGFCG
ncbi:MAG: hypothetical protein DRJ42_04930 [Deltaproteobacteria bacterium]|nr:MAG: hypothetical protein DRJ42_04930 [Deltaproteobacteria bacterium]